MTPLRDRLRLGATSAAIVLALLLSFKAAQAMQAESPLSGAQPAETATLSYSQAPLAQEIRLRVMPLAGDARESHEQSALRRLYELRGFRPAWRLKQSWTAKAEAAIAALTLAEEEGRHRGPGATQAFASPLEGGWRAAAEQELLLSRAMLRYVQHRRDGNVPEGERALTLHGEGAELDSALVLAEGLESPDFVAWLANLEPQRQDLAELRRHYHRLRALARQGGYPSMPEGATLQPGSEGARVALLRQQLTLLGDLGPGESTLPTMALRPIVFDAATLKAVRQFQARHGLEVDGLVGPNTRSVLNLTPAERAETLLANLERARRLPQPKGRYLVVNVAGFELTAYEEGEAVKTMAVIVGQPNWPTPLLADHIQGLVLRPTWTVPSSIARKEFLPNLIKNPGYLEEEGYLLFAGWGPDAPEIDGRAVDWTQLQGQSSKRFFPFRIVQPSGPDNALGRVRFSLTNKLGVYLHDTPTKRLFERPNRALSHGCVRVSEPLWLASFAIKGTPGWTRERLETEMAKPEDSYWLRLAEPLPIFLVYRTAWVDQEGLLQIRRDIYGHDRDVLAALESARSS